MWIETTEGRQFVTEISKRIVIQTAPEELDLFDELVQEYSKDPKPPSRSTPARDDELGFGLEDALIAVTPAAMAMASAVLNYLLTEVVKATQKESAMAIEKRVKALFNPQPDPKGSPALTREQLEQVKGLSRKVAIQFGIKSSQADKMANALVGSLALES